MFLKPKNDKIYTTGLVSLGLLHLREQKVRLIAFLSKWALRGLRVPEAVRSKRDKHPEIGRDDLLCTSRVAGYTLTNYG
jgi:hypothetical protein